jgi:hypothetical protein
MRKGKRIDCVFCGKEGLSKDEIGLNKKRIHRQVERMMCIACMAAYFETTEDELKDLVERFKQQGCALFG